MSWKKKVVRIVSLLTLFACVVGLVLLTSFNAKRQGEVVCDKVDISVDQENGMFFLDVDDIKNILVQQFGDSVKGDQLQKIDVGRIEKVLENDPYVHDAETWLDANGELHIKIVQKQPIARVINKYGVNYYINENANKIPISSKFTTRVPVVTGNIQEGTYNSNMIETPVLKNVLKLTQFIHNNTFWNAQIEQVSVTNSGSFVLIPKLGDHKIEFGGISNMEEKFQKLEIFYEEGLSYAGWEKYETIKLDYKGQIVCVKKINYEQE